MCTFSGLQADARVLIDHARFEAQSFRFNMEDQPTIEYLSRQIAEHQQKYTQKPGVRPFGVSMLYAGFQDGAPKLFLSEPSGAHTEWKANAIGRNASTLREFMEKKWAPNLDNDSTVTLAVETLLEVVEDAANIEIIVCTGDKQFSSVDEAALKRTVILLKQAKEEEEARKKKKKD